MPIKSGRYHIINVQHRNLAFLPDANQDTPLGAAHRRDIPNEEWKITDLRNGSYSIINFASQMAASARFQAKENDHVVGNEDDSGWLIKRSSTGKNYMIFTLNSRLVWWLEDSWPKTPIILHAPHSSDTRCQWTFKRIHLEDEDDCARLRAAKEQAERDIILERESSAKAIREAEAKAEQAIRAAEEKALQATTLAKAEAKRRQEAEERADQAIIMFQELSKRKAAEEEVKHEEERQNRERQEERRQQIKHDEGERQRPKQKETEHMPESKSQLTLQSNHPTLSTAIQEIRNLGMIYFDAIDTSIETASDGYGFSSDAVQLCDFLLDPETSEEDHHQYIQDMKEKAKIAWERCTLTLNQFRSVRKGLNEIMKKVPEEVFEEDKTKLLSRAPLLRDESKREWDKELVDAISKLNLTLVSLETLSEDVNEFMKWWNEIEAVLKDAESKSSGLRPGRDKGRVRQVKKIWSGIIEGYGQYKTKIVRLQDCYPSRIQIVAA